MCGPHLTVTCCGVCPNVFSSPNTRRPGTVPVVVTIPLPSGMAPRGAAPPALSASLAEGAVLADDALAGGEALAVATTPATDASADGAGFAEGAALAIAVASGAEAEANVTAVADGSDATAVAGEAPLSSAWFALLAW